MGETSPGRLRSNLYHALAEALAEPPGWLANPGSGWRLAKVAASLGTQSAAACRAVKVLQGLEAESMAERQARSVRLSGSREIWWYESAALSGRLLGPETLEVERWYRTAGLEISGAELPDHVSLELEFLGYLSGYEPGSAHPLEREFLHRHAGRWMPAFGQALAASGDEVYAPVGRLLRDYMEEVIRQFQPPDAVRAQPAVRSEPAACHARRLPAANRQKECILCGVCVLACPCGALRINESAHETCLQLSSPSCTGCGRCAAACQFGALQFQKTPDRGDPAQGWIALRASPRAVCRVCGEPLISQAELAYVSAQLGRPAWVELCEDCRAAWLQGNLIHA